MKSFKQMIKDGDVRRADAMKIALDDIHEEPGFNLREDGPELDASIESLAAHIANGGMIPPLEVRPRENGGVWVVDGHRRRRALLLARSRGTPVDQVEIRAFVGNDADRIARVITSAEGRSLTPLEVARGYQRLTALGLTPEEIAARVNKTVRHVEQGLVLIQTPTSVQRAVSDGVLSASLAVKLARKHGDDAAQIIEVGARQAKAAGKRRVMPSAIEGPSLLALARELVSSCKGDARNGDLVSVDGEAFRALAERVEGA